ncbi:MAG: hypothetical protein M3498_11235 [Deinococcota bacterium]|jgi:predicted nucleic acid-binding protein|nr:hypothetical protein [Deinococcota bacterium]
MQGRVLADTGPLYAYALARDSLHERAKVELAQLKAARTTLVVTYSVLLEADISATSRVSSSANRSPPKRWASLPLQR